MRRVALLSLVLPLAAVATAPQPLKWLRVAAYGPEAKRIATAGDENIVRVYDAESGALKVSKTLPKGPNSFVTQLVWLGKNRIATSGSDGRIRVFDASDLKELRSWASGSSYVSGIAAPKSGSVVATSSYDNLAKLWDASTGKLKRKFTGLRSDAYAVAMSQDGKFVASGGPDGTCHIWRAADGVLVRKLKPGQVMSIAFSPDGKYIATDGKDMKYYLYELATGKLVLSQPTDSGKAITSLAFSPDSKLLAVGDYGNQAIVIDLSGELKGVMVGHTENLSSVEFSPDGKNLLTASFDGTAKIWNVESGECLKTLGGK